jgi:pentose-5-phosphate-3-epimerase
MQIIPALLTYSKDELREQFQKLKPFYNRFQIDIADNTLVPNTTLQIQDVFETVEVGPEYDMHLMVNDYAKHIALLSPHASLFNIGVIFIHAGLKPNLEKLHADYPQLTYGLVFNPEDDIKTILSNNSYQSVQHLQVMSIKPGFQGSPFIEKELEKVEHIGSLNYGTKSIYLDGGINAESLPIIVSKQYQPDFLCVGSFLTKAPDLAERVRLLSETISGKKE